ncbi:MAG: TonB-dependent receptor domain-containing protein [Polaromonas sp.]|jgi:vitamin B12 transporter
MKIGFNRARLAALPFALATTFPVSAQPSDGTQLKELVVTASRVATPITDAIADISIITREQLDRAGQSSLRDVLAQQPGVQLTSSGSYRSSTGVFLRGAATTQTIVLIDGIRVGSATTGGVSYENLPLSRIERIEILRGASSALYGPDAVGGVIQIFTRAPSDGIAVDATLGSGSDGHRQSGASIRGTMGEEKSVAYSFGASRESATGISAIVDPLSTNYNPDLDGFKSASFDAKLTAKLNKEHSISLGLLRSDTEYQFDGMPSPNPLALTKLTSDARSKARVGTHIFRWDAQWLPSWKSIVTVGGDDEKSVSDYYRVSDRAPGGSSRFNTARSQYSWQNDFSIGRDVLSATLENRNESVDSETVYTINKRRIQSTLLSYALNRDQWNALAVIRNDKNSQFGSFNNGSLAGGYRLTPSLRWVASAGTSFQSPTFNQLYFPGFGTPTLAPQKNRALETGLKYQEANVSLGAVVYRNNVQGFIVPSTNVQSSLAVLRGVTLSAGVQSGNTGYALSYDYADPKSYSAVAASNDLRLVRVARSVLNASIHHRIGQVKIFGELKMSGDRQDAKVAGAGRDVLAGYSVINTGLAWSFYKNMSLQVRINNLTNKNYMLANSFSIPGRNAFASVSFAM